MKAAIFFAVYTTLFLNAMDDGSTEPIEATQATADDAFFKSMLATPGRSSSAYCDEVRTALEASTNRYKNLMEDAPAVRDRNQSILNTQVTLREPGNYCIPGIFAVYQKNGSCMLKSGSVNLAVKGTQFHQPRAGQRVSCDGQDGESVLLFMTKDLLRGESLSNEQIEGELKDYMPSPGVDVLKSLADGIEMGKDEGGYLLYVACKEECGRCFSGRGGLQDKESVRGLFLETVRRLFQGEQLEPTPTVLKCNEKHAPKNPLVKSAGKQ